MRRQRQPAQPEQSGSFSLQVSPRLNRGLRCEGAHQMQALLCSRRIPGPTSFWKVVAIAPDGLFFRKVFSPAGGDSLHGDNMAKLLSGPRATPLESAFR